MNHENALFTVIIPVYNKWQFTEECLTSLKRYTPDGVAQIIVVDNASTDATATELAPLGHKLFAEKFKTIHLESNSNFAHACNIGASSSTTGLLYFLNNDTLLTPNWHTPLLDALHDNTTLGAVGPLLLYPQEDTVQHVGISYAPGGLMHLYRMFPATHHLIGEQRYLQAISAAALMIHAETFVRCGGFYEGYKNGFEDVELSCRIHQLGQRVAVISKSRVYHFEGQSQGRHAEEAENGHLLFERCNDFLYYDLHLHAGKDGYKMALTPDLNAYMTMLPHQENNLNSNMEGQNPQCWLEGIKEEPLWQQGYSLLIDYLLKHKQYNEALALTIKQINFFPLTEYYAKAAKTAILAGQLNLGDELRQAAIASAARTADKPALFRTARQMLDKENKKVDESLRVIYAAWMREYMPQEYGTLL